MQAVAAFKVALQYDPQSLEISKKIKRLIQLAREKKRAEEVENIWSNIDMGKYFGTLETWICEFLIPKGFFYFSWWLSLCAYALIFLEDFVFIFHNSIISPLLRWPLQRSIRHRYCGYQQPFWLLAFIYNKNWKLDLLLTAECKFHPCFYKKLWLKFAYWSMYLFLFLYYGALAGLINHFVVHKSTGNRLMVLSIWW